jgi:nucleoside-diphosphate-sugar epimerase
MILRMGNVFGFKKNINPRMIAENLVHNLCSEAIIKKKILIDKGFIQRTFVPSEIFVKIINLIISKKIFENSIANISYKILSLKDIAKIIQKRLNLRLNIHTNIVVKNIFNKKKYLISLNKNLSFKVSNKTIYNEIDQILEFLNKNLRKKNSF